MPLDPIAAGSTRSYPLRIYRADDVTPSTAYLPSDVLACELWAGDARATAATPAAYWDPAPPDYRVTLAPADTAGLVPGTYRIRVTAARGSDVVEVLRDTVEVLAVAGSAAERPAYCTLNDMQVQCAWIGQYLDAEADQAGFAEQRAQARDWMDGLILAAQPVAGGLNLISRQNDWTWSSSGANGYGMGLSVDQVLRAKLDAGGLILTGPSGARVVRACACHAVATVLGSQPEPSTRGHGGFYRQKANAEASVLVAEISTTGNPPAEYAIGLGLTNTRYG